MFPPAGASRVTLDKAPAPPGLEASSNISTLNFVIFHSLSVPITTQNQLSMLLLYHVSISIFLY